MKVKEIEKILEENIEEQINNGMKISQIDLGILVEYESDVYIPSESNKCCALGAYILGKPKRSSGIKNNLHITVNYLTYCSEDFNRTPQFFQGVVHGFDGLSMPIDKFNKLWKGSYQLVTKKDIEEFIIGHNLGKRLNVKYL